MHQASAAADTLDAMIAIVLSLLPAACALASVTTWLVLRASRRLGAFDSPPLPGQIKAAHRKVPNTGGIGIFVGVALPMLAGLLAVPIAPSLADTLPEALVPHLPGMHERLGMGAALLGSLILLHVMGLVDDRRPLGPFVKLVVMAVPAVVLAWFFDTRLLTLLDAHVGGSWASILITVVWFVAVTNAFNFIDNMDGLAAGVAAVASACLLATTLIGGQWFVAAVLALTLGASLGFLVFNFPPARIFMGDSGSLVLGFLLAFLTVRATYLHDGSTTPPAHAVFTPVVILAVPLYDLVSVVIIRLSQGKSPFVGDLQHFSHRLVKRGLSRRAAVVVIWGFTLVIGISGIFLPSLQTWQAVLVGVQTALVLTVIAIFERASSASANGGQP
ncbi:MAG: undecaprenyl/decaprenyl-phosphate alpha-N-acetylglucosaminyl 1-phosphate transferase [Planctomycetota bacterium]|nr:MAG: undecaprenyl/decaprenyl-phosphate alpha-N-acetylglucosaminyl 1-phosphate transferase [Planctomycetota bacterium]